MTKPRKTTQLGDLTPLAVDTIATDWMDRLRKKVSGRIVDCRAPAVLLNGGGGGRLRLADEARRVVADALDGLLADPSELNWASPHGKEAARQIDPMLAILLDFGGDWCDGNAIGEKTIALGARLWRMSGGVINNGGGTMAAHLLGDSEIPYTRLSGDVRERLVDVVVTELNQVGTAEKSCLVDILLDAFPDHRFAAMRSAETMAWRDALKRNGALTEALVNGCCAVKPRWDRWVAPEERDSVDRALNQICEFLEAERAEALLLRWPDLRSFPGFDVHWERGVLRAQSADVGRESPRRSI